MKMLRRFLALAVSMALAASLVACGSGSGTESGGSTAGSTPSSGEKRALCMGTGPPAVPGTLLAAAFPTQ